MIATALQGVKVLDLSRILAGPWCTQNLADLGAEVVKVESLKGDDTRGWGPWYLTAGERENVFSAYYLCCNRGKKSMAVDFSRPEGAALVRRLAREADVVVENFKSGGLKKYGLDYDSLKEIKPDVIYLSITGFGHDGPMAGKPGYDYVFQGYGGIMSYTGHPDGQPGAGPLRVGTAVVDLMTGMYATVAVLGALLERGRTGEGQFLDITLADVSVAVNANQNTNFFVSGKIPERIGNTHPNLAPYEVFAAKDAYLIIAIGNDGQFARFCERAGHPELALDERFLTNSLRIVNLPALRPLLHEIIAQKTRAEWGELLESINVPWGPINTVEQAFNEPQIKHRQMRQTLVHPLAGDIPAVRNPAIPPMKMATLPPPLLGEHTETILASLGVDGETMARLCREGVVAGLE